MSVDESVVLSSQDQAKESVKSGGEGIKGLLSNPMFVYVVRRIFVLIPLWLGISIVSFAMVRLSGDPRNLVIATGKSREAIIHAITIRYNLNDPYPVQYYSWLKNFFTWQFGYSGTFDTRDPSGIMEAIMWETAKLQYAALFLAIIIAIPLGIIAAKNRNTSVDYSVSAFALLGLSMPIYLTGFILIRVFGGEGLNWFPSGGSSTPYIQSQAAQLYESEWRQFIYVALDSMHHLVLPLIALTFFQLALITRLVRSSMLEVLNQDYILAARANGIKERRIIWLLALRNAIIPAITFIAISIGTALGGAPITETVFNWPGLGIFFVKAINARDMAIILGITMIITTLILLSNLLADILYVYIDPRIRV